jgi:hypothetical protein
MLIRKNDSGHMYAKVIVMLSTKLLNLSLKKCN